MRAAVTLICCLIWPSVVHSQQLPTYLASPIAGQLAPLGGTTPTAQDYFSVQRIVPSVTNVTGYDTVAYGFLPVLSTLNGTTTAGATGPQGPVGATGSQGPAGATNTVGLIEIATKMDRLKHRLNEGIALAGAMNVLPPNPGDRFALSLGGAGYERTGAGSVSVSFRITDESVAYLGYARGPNQNLVKGGVGFSFR